MRLPPYFKTSIVAIVLFVSLLIIKGFQETSIAKKEALPIPDTEQVNDDPSEPLIEDKRVYDGHNLELKHVYITIFDQGTVPGNDISFYDLNESYKEYSNLDSGPNLDILFQSGTEDGPSDNGFLSAGSDVPNATIELRGRSSRLEAQKSYKIRLQDNGGLWYGQKVINLNKHADDQTRVRNKLAFDYFKKIPNTISLRTDFVQLHVKDLTNSSSDKEFVDYGLYTHIEQLNDEALAARGLNPDGHLYKAENFEFYRYPEQLKLSDDATYEKKVFESILKINGSENHEELLTMLEDVNDVSKPFDQVFKTYFNEDNYLTWLALNIMFGNYDTMSTNYYLYSPLNSDKWYFIPWDFDKALGRDLEMTSSLPDWQLGIQRYWGTVLHKRYLRDPQNVEKLTAKIEEISGIVNEETTKGMIDQYYPLVKAFVLNKPDLTYLKIEANQYDTFYKRLETITTRNKDLYYESIERPMPIFLHYERKNDQDTFAWDVSHDLQGDSLTYHFQLSSDPDFKHSITDVSNAKNFSFELDPLPSGRYYWRVLVEDGNGHEQIPFDYYRDNEKRVHWGVQEIIIP
ncbi:CotH kinase family protein [Robertmurraya korlensis]|uniref:CotH kinase family protein n=1 Tax=Robertmurraya korlensis TaxID=519977 RepID=UPI000825DAFF|nr:CotH kinase family protein [Robertmurraya korlensis]